jgi:hypothetical protein
MAIIENFIVQLVSTASSVALRLLFPKQPMPPMAGRLADVEHTCGVWIKRPWNGANRLVRTAQIRHMPQPARDRVTII